MIANIFVPCLIDQFFPKTAENLVKILEYYKVEVIINNEQTCCGKIAFDKGYYNYANELSSKFVKDFNNGHYIVVPSVSCVTMVQKNYPKMFKNTSLHHDSINISNKIFEFSDFFFNILNIKKLGVEFSSEVVIHTNCSDLREYRAKGTAMQSILSTVTGLTIHPLNDHDICCGSGYSFSTTNHPISIALAEDKIDNAIVSGAKYFIFNEPSCLLHISSYVKKNEILIEPIHIVDFLAKILKL